MSIVREEITFDGRAPSLVRIAATMTELCGQPVTVTESDADIKGDLYDMHGHLALASAPQEQIKLWTYRPGTVRQFLQDNFGEVELPISQVVSLNEAEGTQVLHLECAVSVSPALLNTTMLALEELGGRFRPPVRGELQEYREPLTSNELHEQQRLVHKQLRNTMLVGCLLMPCLLPLWFLGFLWTMLSLSLGIGKAGRMYREVKRQMREDGP